MHGNANKGTKKMCEHNKKGLFDVIQGTRNSNYMLFITFTGDDYDF